MCAVLPKNFSNAHIDALRCSMVTMTFALVVVALIKKDMVFDVIDKALAWFGVGLPSRRAVQTEIRKPRSHVQTESDCDDRGRLRRCARRAAG